MRFNIRFCPAQTVDTLKSTVLEVLARHGVRHSLEWFVSGLPFYTPPGPLSNAAISAVQAVTGKPPKLSTSGGTSDGRFIAPMGAQIVEVGVINRTIHKVNESVRISELQPLHEVYLGILERLLPNQ